MNLYELQKQSSYKTTSNVAREYFHDEYMIPQMNYRLSNTQEKCETCQYRDDKNHCYSEKTKEIFKNFSEENIYNGFIKNMGRDPQKSHLDYFCQIQIDCVCDFYASKNR